MTHQHVSGISGYFTEVFDGNMAKGDTRITIVVKRLKNRDRHKCLEVCFIKLKQILRILNLRMVSYCKVVSVY